MWLFLLFCHIGLYAAAIVAADVLRQPEQFQLDMAVVPSQSHMSAATHLISLTACYLPVEMLTAVVPALERLAQVDDCAVGVATACRHLGAVVSQPQVTSHDSMNPPYVWRWLQCVGHAHQPSARPICRLVGSCCVLA